jgi:hypothetical protein
VDGELDDDGALVGLEDGELDGFKEDEGALDGPKDGVLDGRLDGDEALDGLEDGELDDDGALDGGSKVVVELANSPSRM